MLYSTYYNSTRVICQQGWNLSSVEKEMWVILNSDIFLIDISKHAQQYMLSLCACLCSLCFSVFYFSSFLSLSTHTNTHIHITITFFLLAKYVGRCEKVLGSHKHQNQEITWEVKGGWMVLSIIIVCKWCKMLMIFSFLEHRRIFKIKMFESLLSIVSKLNFYEIFIEILVLQKIADFDVFNRPTRGSPYKSCIYLIWLKNIN